MSALFTNRFWQNSETGGEKWTPPRSQSHSWQGEKQSAGGQLVDPESREIWRTVLRSGVHMYVRSVGRSSDPGIVVRSEGKSWDLKDSCEIRSTVVRSRGQSSDPGVVMRSGGQLWVLKDSCEIRRAVVRSGGQLWDLEGSREIRRTVVRSGGQSWDPEDSSDIWRTVVRSRGQ